MSRVANHPDTAHVSRTQALLQATEPRLSPRHSFISPTGMPWVPAAPARNRATPACQEPAAGDGSVERKAVARRWEVGLGGTPPPSPPFTQNDPGSCLGPAAPRHSQAKASSLWHTRWGVQRGSPRPARESGGFPEGDRGKDLLLKLPGSTGTGVVIPHTRFVS